MRFSVFLLVLCLNQFSNAQEENVQFVFPEIQTLFQGYDHLLSIGFKDKSVKQLRLVCAECDTIIKLKDGNYIVRPGMKENVTIQVFDRKKKLVSSESFKVFKIPMPIMRLDNFEAFSEVDSLPIEISLNLSPEVPLRIGFPIFNWSISIEGKTVFGSGRLLSEEAKKLMLEKKKGMMIVEVHFRDVFEKRILTEGFTLNL